MKTVNALSLADATAALAKAQAAYARIPEGHADEGRLYAKLLEAEVVFLRAKLDAAQSETRRERIAKTALSRQVGEIRAALDQAVEAQKNPPPRPKRVRAAGSFPLLDYTFGADAPPMEG